MSRYVRICSTGRVGILRSYNKRDWIDWIRGYKATASVMGLLNEHSIELVHKDDVEEISEKEYFKERLSGN